MTKATINEMIRHVKKGVGLCMSYYLVTGNVFTENYMRLLYVLAKKLDLKPNSTNFGFDHWWPKSDSEPRLKLLNYLLEEHEKDKDNR